MDDGVQLGVFGQAVLILLVGPQLGGGRLGQDALGDRILRDAEGIMGVAPFTDPVDVRLVDILQDIIATAHVAIEGGVAYSHFALVAGGQQHVAKLVG